jgi:hypothetical protein
MGKVNQMKKNQPPAKQETHFFDLPLELRWMIYELVVEDATVPTSTSDDYTPASFHLGFLLTSRQVYAEAKELVFKRIVFIIDMRRRKVKLNQITNYRPQRQFCDVQVGEGPRPLDQLLDTLISLRQDTRKSIQKVIVMTPVSPMVASTNVATVFTKVHDILATLVYLLPQLKWLGMSLCPG